jgi:hypothetical protein
MVETFAERRAQAMDVRVASLPELLDAASSSENVLSEAVAFCARKVGADSLDAAVDLLRQNERTACGYCLYSIAKQLAASLGAVDENVKAVYVLDYDATPEDLCFGTLNQGAPLVHLIVWAERKTAALSSLVAALDRALAQAYTDLVGGPQAETLLDVQMIDDADVENRTGHGVLLQSIHHRPIEIWKRKTR